MCVGGGLMCGRSEGWEGLETCAGDASVLKGLLNDGWG